MSWYAIDAIDDAIDATRAFLFPFSLGRWARLALITIFLGAGGIGGQFSNLQNFGNFGSFDDEQGATGGAGGFGDPSGPGAGGGSPADFGQFLDGPGLGLLLGVVGVILLLVLLFGILSATMEFVFVDVLSRDDVRVREPFKRVFGKGLRLFGFRIGLQLLFAVPFLGVIAAALTGVVGFEQIGAAGVLFGILVFGGLAILSGLVTSFTTQFVVPVMLATDETVLGGWRRLWPRLREQWKQTVVYFLMHVLIGIGIGIVRGFLVLLGAIPVLIVAGLLAVVAGAVAGGVVSGPAGFGTGVVVAALVGIPLFFLFVILPVNVLTKTYVRTFELRSLAGFDPDFDLLPRELFDGPGPSAAAAGAGGGDGGGRDPDTFDTGDTDGGTGDSGRAGDDSDDSDDSYRSVEDMFDEDDDDDRDR
jgi:hypothetical protein